MPDNEEKKAPLKVNDRRSFTPDGQRRSSEPEAPAQDSARTGTVQGEGFELRQGPKQSSDKAQPQVEFSSFILSLASTAFIQLGELEDPATHKLEVNLEGARQMIEILDMLHNRTQGNLDAQEEEFLSGVL